jgi:nucleoside-diphosphate-sugar epimerase
MNKKILIMGVTGKVGYEVVKSLCAHKAKVKAVVHQPQHSSMLSKLGVEFVSLNLAEFETIQQASMLEISAKSQLNFYWKIVLDVVLLF